MGIKGLLLSALGTWLDPQSQSPVLSVLGYAVTDTHRPPAPAPQARDAEAVILSRLVDLSAADGSPAGVARAAASLAAKGCKILWPGARQRGSSAVPNSVWKESPAFVVPCDAIVVGSGAGGGVTAARLAAGGLQVTG